MTDDIVAFIKERLEDDERIARSVQDNSAPWTGQWKVDGEHALRTYNDWVLASHHPEPFQPGFLLHVAHHDPARVLRGVEAKRRILDLAVTVLTSGYTDSADAKMVSRDTIRNLASEWSTHDSYREDWKP